MDVAAVAVALVVLASLAYLVWSAGRRNWNADGADDRRREEPPDADDDAEAR